MPRKPRFTLPGIPQHIIQRGNNRKPCFFDQEDFQRYLIDLKAALQNNECELHAYVLMSNHIHMLVTPFVVHGVSHVMQDLGRKYVKYINRKYKRTGTLWEGRYKACLVDSEAYLLTCMRYIELNPVRAGMVIHPGEYGWSSYATNAQGRVDDILSRHPVYTALGDSDVKRQRIYRDLFTRHPDFEQVSAIRTALNQELVIGRDDFKEKLEQVSMRQTRRGKDGRPRIKEVLGKYVFNKDESEDELGI